VSRQQRNTFLILCVLHANTRLQPKKPTGGHNMNLLVWNVLGSFLMAFSCVTTADAASDGRPIRDTGWSAQVCESPKIVCSRIIAELAEGSFLDFRARPDDDQTELRLLSPFAVERIEALDKARCVRKLCPAQVALAGLQDDLLKQGYYTQSTSVFHGGAVITLRTERIDSAMKVLKGKCRFDLDPPCTDSDPWLQDDRNSGEKCGFAQTRLFVVTPTLPAFVETARFAPAAPTHSLRSNLELLNSVSFDTATAKIYELLYVHKICPGAMTIVRNG
jgi:hypothetical protein